jgi:hypothetical protein
LHLISNVVRITWEGDLRSILTAGYQIKASTHRSSQRIEESAGDGIVRVAGRLMRLRLTAIGQISPLGWAGLAAANRSNAIPQQHFGLDFDSIFPWNEIKN